MLTLETEVKFVKGIGARIADALVERRIATVEDLLYHLPFRYEDRLNPRPISDLKPGEMASVIGEVRGSALLRTRGGPIFEMTVGQGLSSVKCMWFHGSYLVGKYPVGAMIALYGRMESSRSRPGALKMIQPQVEVLPTGGGNGLGGTGSGGLGSGGLGSGSPDAGGDAEFNMLEVGRIVPVYEFLGGTTAWGAKLTSRWLRRVIWGVLEDLSRASTPIPETLPENLRQRLRLMPRLAALRQAHFPEAGTPIAALQSASTEAHRRLIFEELFYLELGLELKRRRMRKRSGVAFNTGDTVREAIKEVLPFHPTRSQKHVLGEIVGDMRKPSPMRRLLQGDVGSGKTIVALQAAIVAMENGYQAALMAPTEILATQHYISARKLLEKSSRRYNITLLTGSLDLARKRSARGRIFRGEAHLVIGTHALIEEKVEFANLGLVVVDEQHRFGVLQRFKLMKKPGLDGEAPEPDVLVMTATPIPRTLALTLYGDLDVSVLDELPPGRTPIVTRRTTDAKSAEVWGFVRKQVEAGYQAYVVYPVIEGTNDDQPELDFAHDPEVAAEAATPKRAAKKSASKKGSASISAKVAPMTAPKAASKASSKKSDRLFSTKPSLKSAMAMHDELRDGPLAGLRIGLLHGRLASDEKEVVMRRFQRGEIDVLVATTVIEVGVDVPNASIMVIEHAERFGLAQMHQLRGRVGRGAAKSYCVLMTCGQVSPQAEERLDAMVRTQNGFELAEVDLQQRGPGEFFGTRQAGLPDFRVANLLRDRKLLELAKQEAARFARKPDAAIGAEETNAVWSRLREHWQRKYGLVEA